MAFHNDGSRQDISPILLPTKRGISQPDRIRISILLSPIYGFDANDEAKLLGINPASVRMKRTRIYQEVQLKHNKETFLRDYIIKNLLK